MGNTVCKVINVHVVRRPCKSKQDKKFTQRDNRLEEKEESLHSKVIEARNFH